MSSGLMIDGSVEELCAVLRSDFPSFVEKVFATLHPEGAFKRNWHIEAFAHELEEIRSGNAKRLVVNVPPRTLKSLTFSVAWVAWSLGHAPAQRFMVVSHSQA